MMFSCDAQVSQPRDANVKDDKAIEEDLNIQYRKSKIPTKIPGPVRLNSSGCYVHISTRKYTTLMKSLQSKSKLDESYNSTSTLVNTCNDSGVEMDSTAEDDKLIVEALSREPDSSTPQLHCSTETLPQSDSALELKAAEEQTLRVLQLAVAEMEADVELNAQILEEQLKLELENQLNLEVEQIVKQESEKMLLQEELQVESTVELVEEVPEELSEEIPKELVKKLSHELLNLLPQKLSEDLSEKLEKQPEPKKQLEFVNLIEPIDQIENFSDSNFAPRERKHVRVEQLLEAENDIQMLHKLLQPNSELCDGESTLLQQPEDEFVLADINKEQLEIILDNASEYTSKSGSFLQSLLTFICSKRIRKLSYPILLCGMAVGLIYYFRKD